MVLALLAVFFTSQLPFVLETTTWSIIASLVVALTLTAGAFLLAGENAPLPLFVVLLMVHATLPMGRMVSVVLAVVITVIYSAVAIARRLNHEANLYSQVCLMKKDSTLYLEISTN